MSGPTKTVGSNIITHEGEYYIKCTAHEEVVQRAIEKAREDALTTYKQEQEAFDVGEVEDAVAEILGYQMDDGEYKVFGINGQLERVAHTNDIDSVLSLIVKAYNQGITEGEKKGAESVLEIAERAFNVGVSSGMDEYRRPTRGGKMWKETDLYKSLTPDN